MGRVVRRRLLTVSLLLNNGNPHLDLDLGRGDPVASQVHESHHKLPTIRFVSQNGFVVFTGLAVGAWSGYRSVWRGIGGGMTCRFDTLGRSSDSKR